MKKTEKSKKYIENSTRFCCYKDKKTDIVSTLKNMIENLGAEDGDCIEITIRVTGNRY